MSVPMLREPQHDKVLASNRFSLKVFGFLFFYNLSSDFGLRTSNFLEKYNSKKEELDFDLYECRNVSR